jgi:hypothetical protein
LCQKISSEIYESPLSSAKAAVQSGETSSKVIGPQTVEKKTSELLTDKP